MALEDKRRWSFPQYGGAVGFREDVTASVLPTHLAACLRNVGAWNVRVDGYCLRFAGSAIGAAFGPMRNPLAPFGVNRGRTPVLVRWWHGKVCADSCGWVCPYIVQRGNNRQEVFFVDDDRRVYLELLAEQADKYGLAIEGYCLMSNHVHSGSA